MIRTAHAVFFTALAVWVGGMAALAFVVAPAVFRAAPTRAAAGAIFGASLRAFSHVEMACAALVVVASVILATGASRGGWAEGGRLALVAVMVLLLFTYAFGVNPAIAEERSRVPDLASAPDGDPARARFDRLHRWSERLFGANLLAGLALLVLSAATIRTAS